MPVWLYRSKISGGGVYLIEGKINSGMIRLGFPQVSVFRNSGIVLENKGKVIFKGRTIFGGGSALSIGKRGTLVLGNQFACRYRGIIICYNKITIGQNVRVGWDSLICDTDFHRMKSADNTSYTKGYGEISIGNNIWVSSYCKIFKNTLIPDWCTVAAGTILSKPLDCRPYSLIYSGGGVKTKYTGFARDIKDDEIPDLK